MGLSWLHFSLSFLSAALPRSSRGGPWGNPRSAPRWIIFTEQAGCWTRLSRHHSLVSPVAGGHTLGDLSSGPQIFRHKKFETPTSRPAQSLFPPAPPPFHLIFTARPLVLSSFFTITSHYDALVKSRFSLPWREGIEGRGK